MKKLTDIRNSRSKGGVFFICILLFSALGLGCMGSWKKGKEETKVSNEPVFAGIGDAEGGVDTIPDSGLTDTASLRQKLVEQIRVVLQNYEYMVIGSTQENDEALFDIIIKKIILTSTADESINIELSGAVGAGGGTSSDLEGTDGLDQAATAEEGNEISGGIKYNYNSAEFTTAVEFAYKYENGFSATHILPIGIPLTLVKNFNLSTNASLKLDMLGILSNEVLKAIITKFFSKIYIQGSFTQSYNIDGYIPLELKENLSEEMTDFQMAFAKEFSRFCETKLFSAGIITDPNKQCRFNENQKYTPVDEALVIQIDRNEDQVLKPFWVESCVFGDDVYSFPMNFNGNPDGVISNDTEIFLYAAQCSTREYIRMDFEYNTNIFQSPKPVKFMVTVGPQRAVGKVYTEGRHSNALSGFCSTLDQLGSGDESGFIFMPSDLGQAFIPPDPYLLPCQ